MSLRFLSIIALFGALFTSCREELPEDTSGPVEKAESFTEMEVPAGFEYKSARVVLMNAHISSTLASPGDKYVVEVFDNNPEMGGVVLTTGMTDQNGVFAKPINVVTRNHELYIKAYLNGLVVGSQFVDIDGPVAEAFIATSPGKSNSTQNNYNPGPDCTGGCDQTWAGNYGNKTIPANTTICLTGKINGKVTFQNGGVLRVCGELKSSKTISLNGNNKLIVSDGGELDIKKININSNSSLETYSNTKIEIEDVRVNTQTSEWLNYSTDVEVKKDFSVVGKFSNYGEVELKEDLLLNTNVPHTFNFAGGIIKIGNDLKKNGGNTLLINEGTIDLEDDFEMNGKFENRCKILVKDNIVLNTDFIMDNGYIFTEDDMTINSSANMILKNGSLASVEDLIIYGDVTGSGNKNAIKIDDYSGVYNSATISGAVDLCDAAGGLNYNYGNFVNGATHNCSVFIPTSACNPEGIGSGPTDTDSDGVPDPQDDFPNDPNKAFISYYPSPTVFGTHVFEDLWPSMGDYDFNDLVMRYQYALITNADNDAVEMEATYHVAALGAGYKNGFGISIESITNADIASVTGIEKLGTAVSYNGNNTESGHSGEAVIIVVDDLNAFSGGYDYVNVEPQGFALALDTINVTVTLASPVSNLNIGAAPFNPFIFVNQERGREVHLMNYPNTDLADLSFFRTLNDASTPTLGSYYKTINNFPWALDIPEQFDYMIEREDIVEGHLFFSQWAQSGGTLYTDWYLDLPGYRNNAKIY